MVAVVLRNLFGGVLPLSIRHAPSAPRRDLPDWQPQAGLVHLLAAEPAYRWHVSRIDILQLASLGTSFYSDDSDWPSSSAHPAWASREASRASPRISELARLDWFIWLYNQPLLVVALRWRPLRNRPALDECYGCKLPRVEAKNL